VTSHSKSCIVIQIERVYKISAQSVEDICFKIEL
jgi:hypothetical protein